MKKYLKIIILLIISIIYSLLIKGLIIKNNIYDNLKKYEKSFQNATINNNYIIPGLKGQKIDFIKTYILNKGNKIYLKNIKPKISISNNRKLLINMGNKYKNSISLIVENNKDIINYSINNNIKINILINNNNFNKNSCFEQIININNYDEAVKQLNIYKKNSKICFIKNLENININNYQKCIYNDNYLVLPSVIIKNEIPSILPGMIIYLDNDMTINTYINLINKIKYNNIIIVFLSNLIKE